MTDELNVALYSAMPPTVLPVFAALRSGIAVSARASTAPALVPRPHRIAVTAFPSTQSGTTVKSKVLVFVMSAGAVTPASTPTHAYAHFPAPHCRQRPAVGVCRSARTLDGKVHRFVASFRAAGRARLEKANRVLTLSHEISREDLSVNK